MRGREGTGGIFFAGYVGKLGKRRRGRRKRLAVAAWFLNKKGGNPSDLKKRRERETRNEKGLTRGKERSMEGGWGWGFIPLFVCAAALVRSGVTDRRRRIKWADMGKGEGRAEPALVTAEELRGKTPKGKKRRRREVGTSCRRRVLLLR